MALPFRLPGLVRRRPWMSIAAAVLVMALLVVAGLRVWIGSDSGRAFVEAQIDGRKAGRYGTIRIDGLSGDPLSDLQVDRLTISDETGIWLDARDIDMEWSPMALLSRTVRLDLARAETIEILRRPVLSPPSPSEPSSGGWSVALSELGIGELRLKQGVAGPEAAFVVEGRFAAPSDRTLQLHLSAQPLEGSGDSIAITLDRNATKSFALKADIDAPARGTIATLIGLNEGEGATLNASASGTLKEGDGFAELVIAGDTTAEITAKIVDADLTASAKIDASHLPLSQRVRDLIGTDAEITLTADTRKRVIPFSTRSRFASGKLDLEGSYRSRQNAFGGPLRADLDFTGLEALAGLDARLEFAGDVDPSTKAPAASGRVTLTASTDSNLPFEELEGPLQLDGSGSRIGFTASLVGQGVFRGNRAAEQLTGTKPSIEIAGAYNRENGQLTVSPSQVILATGTLAVEGGVDIRGRKLNLAGQVRNVPVPGASASDTLASGDIDVSGTLTSPQFDANLQVRGLSSLNSTLADALGPSPQVTATVRKEAEAWGIRSFNVEGTLLTASGSGRYGPDSELNVSGRFSQREALGISGAQINLSAGEFQVAGTTGVQRVSLSTTGGRFEWRDVAIEDLAADIPLRRTDAGWTGPVELEGTHNGMPATLAADLTWQDGELRLSDITGSHEAVSLAGEMTYGTDGKLIADISASGDGYTFGERSIGEFEVQTALTRRPGEAPDITATGQIANIVLGPGLRFDRISGKARNAPEGYNFSARLVRDHATRPSNLSISGSAQLDAEYPSGQIEMDGMLLGEQVASQRPMSWRLGESPAVDAELAIFGGQLQANVQGAGDDASLSFHADSINLGPLLASVGLAAPGSTLNGQGELYLFGENPRGTFTLAASGAVPGVEESFDLDLTGQLDAGALTLNGQSTYGGKLNLTSNLSIPIEARPGSIARPSMNRPIDGTATLNGNLSALRSVALAYGHDIGGLADGRARIAGTLAKPEISADLAVSDGVYEFGTTGLRLTNVALNAGYMDQELTVDGTASGADGGTARFEGRLSGPTTNLSSEFSDLLLYNRDGDMLRASGDITLSGDPDGRKVSGDMQVQSARFSIENLPSARPQAIDVRWKDDGEPPEEQSKLRRTLALDLDIKADRRVYISGRGLESEWGADLNLTGTPAAPLLNGQADLKRGTLDLAGRPFVFDTGAIHFDGPASRARLDVNAERSVNGFTVRVALTGSPTKPGFELSSTPELPQDEILSRLLFGRSSVDLSALEAAQLANSIARLSGSGTGFDPASELQAALGIDRLTFGTNNEGSAQVGIGQYLAEDVYLELHSAGAAGSSVEVEWEPRPRISVTSETTTTGEARVSVKWKKDY